MPNLIYAIDWFALLKVAIVSIVATSVIAALMSAANWLFTPTLEAEVVALPRRILGIVLLALTIGVILFGLYLMIFM